MQACVNIGPVQQVGNLRLFVWPNQTFITLSIHCKPSLHAKKSLSYKCHFFKLLRNWLLQYFHWKEEANSSGGPIWLTVSNKWTILTILASNAAKASKSLNCELILLNVECRLWPILRRHLWPHCLYLDAPFLDAQEKGFHHGISFFREIFPCTYSGEFRFLISKKEELKAAYEKFVNYRKSGLWNTLRPRLVSQESGKRGEFAAKKSTGYRQAGTFCLRKEDLDEFFLSGDRESANP